MSETLSACDCRWPEDDLAPEKPCGCGLENVRLYRDTAWHWHGQHWRSACLITALEAQVRDLTAQVEQRREADKDLLRLLCIFEPPQSSRIPPRREVIDKINDLRARLAAQAEQLNELETNNRELALACSRILLHEPRPDGTWDHHTICNGDRRQPPGTPKITCNCAIASRKRVEAAEAEIARVREALRMYGQHSDECDYARVHYSNDGHVITAWPREKPCTCGFGATLDEQKEQEKIDARVDGSR